MYKSVHFTLDPFDSEKSEILTALLDASGFEGIYEDEESITAYIKVDSYEEGEIQKAYDMLKTLGCSISWTVEDIPDQNWNRVWESNFDPVVIDKRCAIRAPFHSNFPEVDIEIIIEPKMSFGTGHHQTTRLMVEEMLGMDFLGKDVLDMGCGTGVLAILAAKLGAKGVTAIDYDTWAYENTLENIEKNSCAKINVLKGSLECIPKRKFDIILANINRNVLLEQISGYSQHSAPEGYLILSGILEEDKQLIIEAAVAAGYRNVSVRALEKWIMLIFQSN